MINSSPFINKRRFIMISTESRVLLLVVLGICLYVSPKYSPFIETFYLQQKLVIIGLIVAICIIAGNYLSRFKTKQSNSQSFAILHILFVFCSALLSGLGLYNAITESNQLSKDMISVISIIFGVVIGYSIHQTTSNILLVQQNAVNKALMALFLIFIFSVSSLFNVVGVFPFLGYGEVVGEQTLTVVNDYQSAVNKQVAAQNLLFEELSSLSKYSQIKSIEEAESGYTCEPHVGKFPGERSELRNNDAERLREFSESAQKLNQRLKQFNRRLGLSVKQPTTEEKQHYLDEVHQDFVIVNTRAKHLYEAVGLYLDRRVKKGQQGWVYYKTKNREQVEAKAYCHDNKFDIKAYEMMRLSSQWAKSPLPVKAQLLDLNSGNSSFKIVVHLIQSILKSEELDDFRIYLPALFAGLGVDVLGFITALILFTRPVTQVYLSEQSKHALNSHYQPKHKVSILPIQHPECNKILLYTESKNDIKKLIFGNGKEINSRYNTAYPTSDQFVVFRIKRLKSLT